MLQIGFAAGRADTLLTGGFVVLLIEGSMVSLCYNVPLKAGEMKIDVLLRTLLDNRQGRLL